MSEIKHCQFDVKPDGNLDLVLFPDETLASVWSCWPKLLTNWTWLFPCRSNMRNWENPSKMPGRLWPWSLLRSVKSEIGLAFFAVFTATDVCIWSPYVAFKVVFGVQKFFVPEWLQNAGFWIRVWVIFRVARDGCPRTCCLQLPGPSLLSSGLYWAEMGPVWRGSLFCHLNSCPAWGCEGWLSGGVEAIVGEKAETPWWTFGVWVSYVF